MAFEINGQKVDENNPESIKKSLKSLWLGYIFFVVGLALLYFMTADRFVCHRSQNICEFQARHIWESSYYTKHTMPLSNITGAHVESHYDSDHKRMYQVVLETTSGERNISNTSSSNSFTHESRAEKINSYLHSQKEELEIKESVLWLLFPFPFIFVGLLLSVYLPYRLKKRLKELERQDKMHFHSDLK